MSALTFIGSYTQGEIPPPITITFKDSAGNPISLSGYTAKWAYRKHGLGSYYRFVSTDPALVVNNAIINSDQVLHTGEVSYTWIATDFSAIGDFEGEMWVGNNSNRYASVRYAWRVLEAITVPSI